MRLAITVGLPRSGKSTVCSRLMEQGLFAVVNPDEVRLALHGQVFYPPAEPLVRANVELMVRALLRYGNSVLIDATNTTQKRRKPWLEMARQFNIPLEAFVLGTPYPECLRRNTESPRPLPEEVIARMDEAYEPIGWEENARHTVKINAVAE